MHVVLSGYYGFHNVGDEAILFSIIQALRNQKPDIDITVLSNDPAYTEKTYGVKAINRWKINEIIPLLKEADGLISGGGSLLQDVTGMKSIPYYTGIMRIAQWLKKPVFIYAQGMGPINKGISKFLVKASLNKADIVTVRDNKSKVLLEDIGVSKTINVVPDPVMGLNGQSFSNDWVTGSGISRPFLTVSVRDWTTVLEYKSAIAQSLDKLSLKGFDIVFIPMHGEHDYHTSKEVATMMKEVSFIAPFDAEIQEKISIIGQSELLVGMRLHALIFSAISITPFVALSYDPKIDAFAQICDQPIAGHVEKNNWGSERIVNNVLSLLQDKYSTEKKLNSTVLRLQQSAIHTAEMVIRQLSK
jgi:polysaccharide pyruvyl transferase CsaB